MSIAPIRRAAAVLATAAVAVPAALAAIPTAASGAGAPAAAQERAAHHTTVVFRAPGCGGCRLQLNQARTGDDPQHLDVWVSREKTVHHGVVRFTVPTSRTHGMSTIVRAPWEEQIGYLTTVAYRYGGEPVGSHVDLEKAQSKSRGTACWAGTRHRRVVLPLRVRQVPVEGVQGRVLGSVAWIATTQEWLRPMRAVYGGVLGSQDINVCG